MIKYFLGFFFLLFTSSTPAQHCPWDGSSFLMINLKEQDPVKVKKIYLLDSSGTIVINKTYYGLDRVEEDTAQFWRNPLEKDANKDGKRHSQYFSFAKNYYVMSFSWGSHPRPYSLLIQYLSGKDDLQIKIPVSDDDVHALCTSNRELWEGKSKPLEVVIK